MESTKTGEPPARKKIVIVAMSTRMLLTFSGPTDVFVSANKFLSNEAYEVLVVSPTPDKVVASSTGIELRCQLSAMEVQLPVDTLIIAGNDFRESSVEMLAPFYNWLVAMNPLTVRRIASVCGGAFVLAKAGILDGRKATTHWNLSEKLKTGYPRIKVDSNQFFTVDEHVYTAAGVTSGIDLALALVEEDFGKEIAVQAARQLVFYLSRPGFQSQFGTLLPVYETTHIAGRLQDWLKEHLHEPLDVKMVADHLHMSVRNLTRVFHKQTGMSPAKFVEKLRVEAARKYLEDTDAPLERIADRCGLGNLVSMRRIFLRHLMATPSDYRRAFRTALRDTITEDLLPIN